MIKEPPHNESPDRIPRQQTTELADEIIHKLELLGGLLTRILKTSRDPIRLLGDGAAGTSK